MHDQAQWYYIILDSSIPYARNYIDFNSYFFMYEVLMSAMFDIGIKHVWVGDTNDGIVFKIFCGKKKLKRIAEEIYLLYLDDKAVIERRTNVRVTG